MTGPKKKKEEWNYGIQTVYTICLLNGLDRELENSGEKQCLIQSFFMYRIATVLG